MKHISLHQSIDFIWKYYLISPVVSFCHMFLWRPKMNKPRIAEYITRHLEHLNLLEAMWNDPKVQLYNDVELPTDGLPSVFLNGPTSRRQILEFNHRCQSVKYLRDAGFTGWIFVPEPRGQEEPGDFTEQGFIHEWESSRRLYASCNSFWVPRDDGEMLGLNTNFEWGYNTAQMIYGSTGQFMVVGWPEYAKRMGLPRHYTNRAKAPIFSSQQSMCEHIAQILQK